MGHELSPRADLAHGKHQLWTRLPVSETSFEHAYRETYDDLEDLAQQQALRKMIMGMKRPD